MTSSEAVYRRVPVGSSNPEAVTVGIESQDGRLKAAVWWDSKGDVDADEAEYDEVPAALEAAEAARALHGFEAVVIVLGDPQLWQPAWGRLDSAERSREPIGDVRNTDLSDDEAFSLARGIEAERDA